MACALVADLPQSAGTGELWRGRIRVAPEIHPHHIVLATNHETIGFALRRLHGLAMGEAVRPAIKKRQRTLGSVVEDLALRDVTTRVARLLLGCMGQHTHIVEAAPDACAHITHQEIASMVGSVREVVQRALKELERDGAIALERTRVRIRDQAKLEHRAHLSV